MKTSIGTAARRARNEARKARRKEARDIASSIFRLGGKKALWRHVASTGKRVRCPQCYGNSIARNGGGCACGGTGVLDPERCQVLLARVEVVSDTVRTVRQSLGQYIGQENSQVTRDKIVEAVAGFFKEAIQGQHIDLLIIDDPLKEKV